MLYSITLHSGRQIIAKDMLVMTTYSGLREGFPNEEANKRIIDTAESDAKRAFGNFPCYMIQPKYKDIQYKRRTYHILPKLICCAFFEACQVNGESDAMAAGLIVIWFQQNFQTQLPEAIGAEILSLNWTGFAKKFDY